MNNDLNTQKWVKDARKNKKLTQDELAAELDMTKAAISSYETGRNTPPYEVMVKISHICNYPLPQQNITSNVGQKVELDLWDSKKPLGEDDIEVPFYKDIRLAAGNGFSDDIEDYNGYKLRFSKSTLRRLNIDPANVICVTADGDSMDPVIPNGATVGINTGKKNIIDGEIYAINHLGLLRIKVLQKLPNNKVKIKSFNRIAYEDEDDSLENISVIGHVFYWSVLRY